ncbi:uncharacterized protein M8220_011117 isoform 1-T1 [Acridotheres tristis]
MGTGRSEDVTTYLPPERAGDLRAEISRRVDGISAFCCAASPLPLGNAEGSGEGLACRAGREEGGGGRRTKVCDCLSEHDETLKFMNQLSGVAHILLSPRISGCAVCMLAMFSNGSISTQS